MTFSILGSGIVRRRRIALLILIALIFLCGGYWAARQRTDAASRKLHEQLLGQARGIARTIDVGQIRQLSFAGDDAARPEFQRLGEQMANYRAVIDCRHIYGLAWRDGELVLGPQSYARDDPLASPPGTLYQPPCAQAQTIFETAHAFTGEPWQDECGTFVSALAPVIDPHSGEVIMVIGLDAEASDWQAALARERLNVVLGLLPAALILYGGILVVWWREQWPVQRALQHPLLRYFRAYAVAAFGLALTLFIAWTAHSDEIRSRHDAFRQLAESYANLTLDAFSDLHNHKLSPLASFFAGSQHVDRDEFRVFAASMAQRLDIQALEWIQPVPAAQKAEWEARAQAEGLDDLIIWQQGDDGAREPAWGREVYYPVWYAEPLAGNQAALGYDLASETASRAALEAALASGLPTATDPFVLVQNETDEPGLLVFWPVFRGQPPAHTLHGLVLAAFRPGAFLRSALFVEQSGDAPLTVDIYQIEAGRAAHHLASSSPVQAAAPRRDIDQGITWPLWVFGKTYALNVYPGPAFLAANPLSAGWTTALTGLVITAALTTIVAAGVHRQMHLEALLRAGTSELRATLYSIGDAVITTDGAGRVQQMNPVAEQLTGWTENEAQGRPLDTVFNIVSEETRVTVESPALRVLHEGKTVGLANRTLLIARDGSERPIADSGAPIRDERGEIGGMVIVFRDQTAERAAQKVLRESEERYRSLFENNHAPMLIIDPTSKMIVDANPAAARYYGWTLDELRQTRIDQINTLPPAQIEAEIARARSEQNYHFFFQHRLADGPIRDVEVFSGPIIIQNQSLLYSIVHDITARKQAEEALRQSQDQLQSIFRVAPTGIGMVRNRVLLQVNQRICEMIGYAAAELIGQDARILYPTQEDYEFVGTEKYRQISEKGTGVVETRWQHRDGTIIHILLASTPLNPTDISQGVIFTALDISERKHQEAELQRLLAEAEQARRTLLNVIEDQKKTEEALVAERSLLRTLVDHLPVAVYVKDAAGRKTLSNPADFHNMGITSEADVLGKTDFEVFPHDLAQAFHADDLQVFQTGQPILNREEKITRPDGTRGWQLTSKMPLFDSAGQITGLVGIGHDITARRQADRVLQLYTEQLEAMVADRTRALQEAQERLLQQERLTVLGQIAGGIAHELRTPLGAIKNAAYLLKLLLDTPDATVEEALDILSREVNTSDRIISSLLNFTRPRRPARQVVDIAHSVERALQRVDAPPSVQVVRRIDALPAILTDANQLEQVWSNLILNAVQAMPTGGRLTVEAHPLAALPDDIAVGFLPEHPEASKDGWLVVSIADTGDGIAAEHLARLFEPLFTTKAAGMGLGLSLVKLLVQANNGGIAVESSPGQGTRFDVFLPLAKA